jgi:hypothetical protein
MQKQVWLLTLLLPLMLNNCASTETANDDNLGNEFNEAQQHVANFNNYDEENWNNGNWANDNWEEDNYYADDNGEYINNENTNEFAWNDDGADFNNDTTDDFNWFASNNTNLFAQNSGLNLGQSSGTELSESLNPAPVNYMAASNLPLVDAPIMSEGSRVYFVLASASILDQPSGQSIATLEKGDHPLVVGSEGSYMRTSEGFYIEGGLLSEQGVGRDRKDGPWMQSGAY